MKINFPKVLISCRIDSFGFRGTFRGITPWVIGTWNFSLECPLQVLDFPVTFSNPHRSYSKHPEIDFFYVFYIRNFECPLKSRLKKMCAISFFFWICNRIGGIVDLQRDKNLLRIFEPPSYTITPNQSWVIILSDFLSLSKYPFPNHEPLLFFSFPISLCNYP